MYHSNRLIIILIAILPVFMLGNCSKESSATSSSVSEGKFVVDEIEVSAIIKKAPSADTVWCYIPFSIKFHFDNCYGNCNQYSVIPDSLLAISVSIDGPPFPQSNIVTYKDTLIEKKDFQNKDSLNITFIMKGAYLKKIDENKYGFLKQFRTELIKKAAVRSER